MTESHPLIEKDRIETAEDYQIQSEINDMRQHANKIIHGIKKLNNNDANRAIWELFQNAVDLSTNSQIAIRITEETLQFSHNGEPFTPMTLDCLFKQVSSKTLEEKKEVYEDTDPIGQYGTGFITTHVFGQELVIDGGIVKGDGYIPLTNFVIDRHTDNWKILANAIRELKGKVADLLKKYEEHYPKPYPQTKFTYTFSSDQNRNAANRAISSLRLVLPYVMTLNPSLKSVEVTQIDGTKCTYKKNDCYSKGELQVRPIDINGEIQEVCYLEARQGKVIIILPLTSNLNAIQFDKSLPRLFLYYPLVGTENLGINFIINSRQFQPTEPRNGLYLKSDNESNAKDEAHNRLLINTASNRIFEFLTAHAKDIAYPVNLAAVNFNVASEDEVLNGYFIDLKALWIDNFKALPLVETESGNIPTTEAHFLHKELLIDEESFKSAFAMASKFWSTIPKRDLIGEWTERMDEWALDGIQYIRTEDIVKKIEEEGNLKNFDNQGELKEFYQFIISAGKADFFNNYRLLPNIKGEFRVLVGNEGLNNSLNITQEMIDIADVIMPEIPKRHVHDGFKFDLEFADYSRKNYATEILDYIGKHVNDKTSSADLSLEFLKKFLEYCKISTTDESVSVPTRMMKLIAQHYEMSEEMIIIPAIKDDELDIRTAQRRLVRLLLNDISQLDSEWVADNITFLKDIVSIGAGYDAYEEMFQALTVFPNQLKELTQQRFLSIDGQIPDEVKNLYDNVLKPNFPVRANLVLDEFKNYLKNKQVRTVRDLTEKIESAFFNEDISFSINEHEYKKEILEIIEMIKRTPDYAKYYPLIYSKRSSILVDLADGEDTFAILSLNSTRIKALAKLGSDPFFDQIVELGREALLLQQQERANFQYKYTIGTHIEKVLRDGLSGILCEQIKVDVHNVQDGQDIIIKIEETPVYYIEVKSRWDPTNSIRMSKNQTLKADKQKDNYALCSVDMTKYTGEKPLEVETVEEIEHCIWFGTDIGIKVAHLIGVLNQEKEPNTIHLDGDYRTLVPMSYVESGLRLKEFETLLIGLLNSNR